MKLLGVLAMTAAIVLGAPAARGQAPEELVAAPVTTHHQLDLAGRRIAYAASVSETVLNDEGGHAVATIFSTAYVREDAANRAARPVVFFFNGGPGSSSDQLHTGAFGPLRSTRTLDAGQAAGPPPAQE